MIVEFSPNSMKMAGYCGGAFLDLFASFEGCFYIFNAHHSGLIPISRQHLIRWVNLTEMDPSSEGFINLLFSGKPLEERTSFHVLHDLGLFDHALDYLIGDRLPPWNGEKCGGADMLNHLHFSSGWSFPEEWGVWSIGKNSTLKFFIGEKLNSCESPTLRVTGRYFGGDEETIVEINDLAVGRYNLRDADIVLPEQCLDDAHMTIRLIHDRPLRPVDSGGSGNNREIKFGIESISIGPSGAPVGKGPIE